MEEKEYHPVIISRKGEITAWFCAVLVVFAWIILQLTGNTVFPAIRFLGIFLVLIASGISLSNWMDRHTYLMLHHKGVHFKNGLRNVELKWDEIKEVQIFPSSWGRKVSVIGSSAHFEFRTLGEVKVQGELKGQMGFLDGEKILDQILQKSRLELLEQNGESYYYGRK